MICPKDLVQMNQKNDIGPVGGGRADDLAYETWTLQVCPICNREVVEFYGAYLVNTTGQANRVAGSILELTSQFENDDIGSQEENNEPNNKIKNIS